MGAKDVNIIAMRFGPGPHLKGLTLMGGIVKSEEVRRHLSTSANDNSCCMSVRRFP